MSIVDQVIAAVTPLESQEARSDAREQARAAAADGSWLALVLDHHLAIEAAFVEVRQADDAASRRHSEKRLASVLTAHSLAEELVLYPAMALHDEKSHATMAYTEQSATKVEMAALEDLDPMSQDYLDKLEHIRGAVAHHMYQEEGNWFLDLVQSDTMTQQRLGLRYMDEFERYLFGAEEAGFQPNGHGPRGSDLPRPFDITRA